MRSRLASLGAAIVSSIACLHAADVDYPKAVAEAQERGNLAEVNRLCAAWSVAEPGDERPHLVLGRVLKDTGHIDRAVEQFELAAEANPLSPVPRCELGSVFLREGKPDMAASSKNRCMDPSRGTISWLTPTFTCLSFRVVVVVAVDSRRSAPAPDHDSDHGRDCGCWLEVVREGPESVSELSRLPA